MNAFFTSFPLCSVQNKVFAERRPNTFREGFVNHSQNATNEFITGGIGNIEKRNAARLYQAFVMGT